MKWRTEGSFSFYAEDEEKFSKHLVSAYTLSWKEWGQQAKQTLPWATPAIAEIFGEYLKLSNSTNVRGEQLATGVYTDRIETRSGKDQIRKTDKFILISIIWKTLNWAK